MKHPVIHLVHYRYKEHFRVEYESRYEDNVAEWLRRETRNLLGSSRAGSNPAVVEFLFIYSWSKIQ